MVKKVEGKVFHGRERRSVRADRRQRDRRDHGQAERQGLPPRAAHRVLRERQFPMGLDKAKRHTLSTLLLIAHISDHVILLGIFNVVALKQ